MSADKSRSYEATPTGDAPRTVFSPARARRKTGRAPGRPTGTGGQAPALTPAQVRVLLTVAGAGANGLRNVALLSLCLCGCRVSEPLVLRRRDVTDQRGGIADSFVLPAEATKDNEHRRVFLTAPARKALAAYLAATDVGDDARLFPITDNYAVQLVKRLMVRANVPGSSHGLRRTCATWLQERGVAPRYIQKTLGHSSLSTTMEYLEASPVNVEKAMATLTW
jgi:integrase